VRVDGVRRLSAAPVVLVEHRVDIAAGRHRNWIAAELAARASETEAYDVAGPNDLAAARKAWSDGGRPVVLVSDGLAGDAVRRAVRAERPDAVVVHTGPDGSGAADSPMVRTFGAGRVNAVAVAELLLGAGPGSEPEPWSGAGP
jgi:beta-N-acetylhexosaminidase